MADSAGVRSQTGGVRVSHLLYVENVITSQQTSAASISVWSKDTQPKIQSSKMS